MIRDPRPQPDVIERDYEALAQSDRLPRWTPMAASKLRPNFPPQLVGGALQAVRRHVESVLVGPFRSSRANSVSAPGFHGKEGVNGSSPLEGFDACPRLKSRHPRRDSNLAPVASIIDPSATSVETLLRTPLTLDRDDRIAATSTDRMASDACCEGAFR
jgi:hypothetical protein